MILDGWRPRTAGEIKSLPEGDRAKAADDDDALLRLREALALCEERGLCIYCGGSRLPCYCRNDG